MFRPSTRDDPIFSSLPQSVKDVLGRPMDKETLIELAKSDTLPLIYNESPQRALGRPITRSVSKKLGGVNTQNGENDEIGNATAWEDDSEEEGMADSAVKQVRFSEES